MPKPASEENKLEWKSRIEQQQRSGLSINKWCQEHQIPRYAFDYWKDKLFSKQLQKHSFAEMKIARSDTICLQARGLHVRVSGDCDHHLRKQLFALLAEGLC